jgi:hypothetical protein
MATITRLQSHPHYRIDNILIDEYGEKIGALGIAIYNALARYADRVTGICHPCIGTIAKKLKLSRTTVKKYLRILLNYCLIAISPRMSKAGDPTSNSYMILDPSPEQVALRRRKLEALLIPQQGTFRLVSSEDIPEGGGAPDDRPPYPLATDPRSPADPKQVFLLNKKERTRPDVASQPTEKQKTCPHPPSEIGYLPSENIRICHHCFGLLDENLSLVGEPANPMSPQLALPECEPNGEPEATQPPVGTVPVETESAVLLKRARISRQIAVGERKIGRMTNTLALLGKLITGHFRSA